MKKKLEAELMSIAHRILKLKGKDDLNKMHQEVVAFNNKVSDTIEFENKTYINLDDSEHEDIMEPAIEKIKDMVAQMPHEAQIVDTLFEKVTSKTQVHKIDLDDITAGFDTEPIFDPVKKSDTNLKKSLNDKLNKGIVIGLNDKIAFIKHLFDGESEDYNRVLSQVSTLNSIEEVQNLILNIVKPDYNNWEGKDVYETRFMELIERKFV